MDALVALFGSLNSVLSATGNIRLKPPMVCAIGAQSSGKSSVIDSLIGLDILPRNTGLCTRCPLEIQLINVPSGVCTSSSPESSVGGWWAEFGHLDGRVRFTDAALVKEEIMRQMDRLCGTNKGISSSTPIGLALYSNHVPDLLLVDLPGMVKMPAGDQPFDIERQIRECWLSYMSQKDTIILAVCAATQDIFADDALKMSLDVDPSNERTVGVLTKVDLMDAGTDARELISGRFIHLKQGFVPVVGRSQRDVMEGMPLEKALLREKLFFQRHPAYRDIAERCGAAHLSKVLSTMLSASVKAWLPDVRAQLGLLLQHAEQELQAMGSSFGEDKLVGFNVPPESRQNLAGQTVLRLLTTYASNFSDMIEGKLPMDIACDGDLLTRQLFGGARLQEHIRSRFSVAVDEWFAGFMDQTSAMLPSAEILMALRNSAGMKAPLYIPEGAFNALAGRIIGTLREQGRRFIDHVYDELRRLAEMCVSKDLCRFTNLKDRVVQISHDLLKAHYRPASSQVEDLLDFELSHVNTMHPDFCGAEAAQKAVARGDDKALFGLEKAPNSSGGSDIFESEDDDAASAAQRSQAAANAVDPLGYGRASSALDLHSMERPAQGSPPSDRAGVVSRFRSHIVSDITGHGPEDPLPVGAIRVGGPFSPFVARPSFEEKGRLPERRPFAPPSAIGEEPHCQHYEIVHLPPRPLPAVITPADLRPTAQEKEQVRVVRYLLYSYLQIVKKNYQDFVPKVVSSILVDKTRRELSGTLVHSLFPSVVADPESLLQENDEVAGRRRGLTSQVTLLRRALQAVDDIRDGPSAAGR